MLTPNFEKIPQALKDRRQWVVWKMGEDEKGRPTKHPYRPHDPEYKAKSNDPKTWNTFKKAVEIAGTDGFNGVGYVFSKDCPYTGVDLDKCRDPESGKLKYCARILVDFLNSYSEVSPRKLGIHILSAAKWGAGNKKVMKCGMEVEVYDRGRYFTMTGAHLKNTPTTIESQQEQVMALRRAVFTKPKDPTPPKTPGPSPPLELSDQELIERAQQAANGEKFARLWAGKWKGGNDQSLSAATAALLNQLAFWTNRDPVRIDRLFRQSWLMRDKWDRPQSGSTWGALEIQKAIDRTPEGYTPHQAGTGKAKGKGKEEADPAPGGGLNLSDLGCARRLVQRHGQDLRYCWLWEKWLVWNGRQWAIDISGEVHRRIKDVAKILYLEAATATDKHDRKKLGEYALKVEADGKQKSIISSVRSESGIPILPDDLDRDPWLFNVANGTLNLKTGELQPYKREHLITKLSPVEYDPEAECPAWWSFLKKIFAGNFPLIEFLQKAAGYALTGSTREQCLFFLYGLGANGKSTLLEIIHTLMGDYASRTGSETFLTKKSGGIPNDVAALRGARLVGAVEVELGRRMAESLIKEMTGGDRITARFLHSEFFTFKPEFKIFLAANHKPVIRGTDNAIWRRIHLIPFNVQIPKAEQDRDLCEKLKAELPGILNWALEGCQLWQEYGLEPPQEVQAATEEYREEMDPLADFLSECCIEDSNTKAKAGDLYKAYKEWADDAGEKYPIKQRDFGMSLAEQGFIKKRGTGNKIFWHGVGFKEEKPQEK